MDSKEGFRVLFEHATIGILVVDEKGLIKLANPFMEQIFGYKDHELIGKPLEILIPDSLRTKHAEHHKNYFNKPKTRPMGLGNELIARNKKGEIFPVEISLGHYESNGEKLAITYISDISERKKSQEALVHANEKYHFIFENSMDIRSIYKLVYDDVGNIDDLIIEEANPLFVNTILHLGFSEDWKGITISKLGFESTSHLMLANQAIKEGKGVSLQIHGPKTQKHFLYTMIPMGKDHCFATLIDNTEQKKAENELRKMNQNLESQIKKRTIELTIALEREKELNEMKSQFVTMASHEFRTPLSAIQSSADLVEKYAEMGKVDHRKRHLERIKSSVKNLTEILNDFLSLEKLEQGLVEFKKEKFNLLEFCEDIKEEIKATLKKGQQIKLSYDGDEEIDSDKKILRNILLNLLSNASKYSEENKEIFLNIHVSVTAIIVKVTDRGIGIHESEQKNLFGKFFRARNAVNIQGTGLGLNIVKHYAEILGGTIHFTSILGEGSTFILETPKA